MYFYRPKTSITIEDCLVFVDPYAEIDEQIRTERLNASKANAKESTKEKKEKEKGIDKLKAQREGVGKYISAKILYFLKLRLKVF